MSKTIDIIMFGNRVKPTIQTLIDDYQKRLCRFKSSIILKNAANSSWPLDKQQNHEEKIILEHAQKYDLLMLLDEGGKIMSSKDLASYLDQQFMSHHRILCAIGGDAGLSKNLKSSTHPKIALGKMTWPHQFVPLLLSEQIYRAECILTGHPYHK